MLPYRLVGPLAGRETSNVTVSYPTIAAPGQRQRQPLALGFSDEGDNDEEDQDDSNTHMIMAIMTNRRRQLSKVPLNLDRYSDSYLTSYW